MYIFPRAGTGTAFFIPDAVMRTVKKGLLASEIVTYLENHTVEGVEERAYIPEYKPLSYQIQNQESLDDSG